MKVFVASHLHVRRLGKRCKKVKHMSNLGNSRFTKMNKFGELPLLTFAYHIGGKRS